MGGIYKPYLCFIHILGQKLSNGPHVRISIFQKTQPSESLITISVGVAMSNIFVIY